MNDKEEFLEAILRDDFPSFIAKVFSLIGLWTNSIHI